VGMMICFFFFLGGNLSCIKCTYPKAYGHARHMWHGIWWKIERTIRNRGRRPNRRLRWNEALCIRIEFKFLITNLKRE